MFISTVSNLEKITSQNGADAWLEKPFELSAFVELTNKLLKRIN